MQEWAAILKNWPITLASLLLCAGAAWLYWNRFSKRLKKWAQANNCTVINYDFYDSSWDRGPFTDCSSESQEVLYVTVRDQFGRKRHVWLRCGSRIGGAFWSDSVEAIWED